MRMNEFEAWASQMADQISGREYVSEDEIVDALKQAFLYGCCGERSVADMMIQMTEDLKRLQSQVNSHAAQIDTICRGIDSITAAVTRNHATMLNFSTDMNSRVGALEEKLEKSEVSVHEILDNLDRLRAWALEEATSATADPAEGSADLISEQSARHATETPATNDTAAHGRFRLNVTIEPGVWATSQAEPSDENQATSEQMAAVQARIAPYDVDQDGRVVLQNANIERATIGTLQVGRSNVEDAEIEVTDEMRAAGAEAMLDLPWTDIELIDYDELAEAAYLAMERVRRAAASVTPDGPLAGEG